MNGDRSRTIRAILRMARSRRRGRGDSMTVLTRDIGAKSSSARAERAARGQNCGPRECESHDLLWKAYREIDAAVIDDWRIVESADNRIGDCDLVAW